MRKKTTHMIDGVKLTVVESTKLGRLSQGYPVAGEYLNNVISIDPRATTGGKRDTLLHELFHHFWERSGLRTLDSKQEEFVISELVPWLLQAAHDAPELLIESFGWAVE